MCVCVCVCVCVYTYLCAIKRDWKNRRSESRPSRPRHFNSPKDERRFAVTLANEKSTVKNVMKISRNAKLSGILKFQTDHLI